MLCAGQDDRAETSDDHGFDFLNDPTLSGQFRFFTAILGFVDADVSGAEPVEMVAGRVQEVPLHLPEDRLIGAPDCGPGLPGTEQAVRKRANLAVVTANV